MAPHSDTVKFLLVDDVAENLLALEGLLRRDGLEFMTARSGPEALELLLRHDFALALLDVQLPDMNGFELAELMRGTERTRRVPIMFLTAVATDERRRFQGYESGAVDYLIKPIDPHILRHKAAVFFELARQRHELIRQRDCICESEERFRRSILQAPTPMVLFNEEGGVLAVNDELLASTGYAAGDVTTLAGWTKLAHGKDAAKALAHFQQTMERRLERSRAEFDLLTADGQARTWDVVFSVLGRARQGQALFLLVGHDVTERKRAEHTQQLLMGELNHRVRNTLAAVQAIAEQTLRHTADPSTFVANFSGRLRSLSRAHAILSRRTWEGADMHELIRDQLLDGTIDQSRLSMEGPAMRLEPQAALHVALTLHELGTNAIKHGALSGSRGHVEVSWSVEADAFFLHWRERDGPAVVAPSKQGFGTTLIQQTASGSGGSAAVTYGDDGVAWHIRLPLGPSAVTSGPSPAARLGSAAEARAPSLPTVNERKPLAGSRFLIVEDEPLVALHITARLRQAGADVLGPVGTADEAMRVVRSHSFDAALLDGNLHGKPIEPITLALATRGIPFVFVTGYSRSSLPTGCGEADILSKPFTEEQLLDAARRLVDRSAALALGPID